MGEGNGGCVVCLKCSKNDASSFPSSLLYMLFSWQYVKMDESIELRRRGFNLNQNSFWYLDLGWSSFVLMILDLFVCTENCVKLLVSICINNIVCLVMKKKKKRRKSKWNDCKVSINSSLCHSLEMLLFFVYIFFIH